MRPVTPASRALCRRWRACQLGRRISLGLQITRTSCASCRSQELLRGYHLEYAGWRRWHADLPTDVANLAGAGARHRR